MAGHCLAQTVFSPKNHLAYSSIWYLRSWTERCLFISPNDGLHPRPWLIGCIFHVLAECRHLSATCPATRSYHHYSIGRTLIHHWGCRVSSDSVPPIPDLTPLTTTLPLDQSQSWAYGRTPVISTSQKSVYNSSGSQQSCACQIAESFASSDETQK